MAKINEYADSREVSIMKPVTKNIVANFYQLFVIFVNQILLVPACLIFMDIEVYGDWIVLTALASFFAMSDLGLSDASNNLFCIKYSAGEKRQCDVILTNNMLLVIGVAILVLLLFIVGGCIIDFSTILGLRSISGWEAVGIVVVMLLQIFAVMAGQVFDAIFKATHQAYTATYLTYSARLLGAALIFIALATRLPLVWVAAIGTAPYLACLAVKAAVAVRRFPCRFRVADFNWPSLRSLLAPTAGSACLLVGNAVLLQCYVLVVNVSFGAIVLVQFTTMRTMMNFVRQVGIAITAGIKPEFSITYGSNDINGMRRLYRKSMSYCAIGGSIAIIGLLAFGQHIYEIWTRGEVPFSMTIFLVFVAIQPITLVWEASSIALTATNRHFKLGVLYITSCVLAVFTASVLAKLGLPMACVAATAFIVDIPMAVYSLRASILILRKPVLSVNIG